MKFKGIRTIAVLTALTACMGAVSVGVDAKVQKKDLDDAFAHNRFKYVKQANAGVDASTSDVRLRIGEKIIIDTCTGCLYLKLRGDDIYGPGAIPLLDRDGKPLTMKGYGE